MKGFGRYHFLSSVFSSIQLRNLEENQPKLKLNGGAVHPQKNYLDLQSLTKEGLALQV